MERTPDNHERLYEYVDRLECAAHRLKVLAQRAYNRACEIPVGPRHYDLKTKALLCSKRANALLDFLTVYIDPDKMIQEVPNGELMTVKYGG